MNRETLVSIIDAIRQGRAPKLSVEDFPCFSPEALEGNAHIPAGYLNDCADRLGAADLPVFERALAAMDAGELAWLGFKIVYDPEAAVHNVDNEVTKKYGEAGSASGDDLVFFCYLLPLILRQIRMEIHIPLLYRGRCQLS